MNVINIHPTLTPEEKKKVDREIAEVLYRICKKHEKEAAEKKNA